jgi:hypothetical protein
MEVHNVTGCMSFSLNIDGKEEINLNDTERQVVIEKVCEWIKRHPENLNDLLQDLTDSFGEYNAITTEPCECCGDIVSEMVLDLDE